MQGVTVKQFKYAGCDVRIRRLGRRRYIVEAAPALWLTYLYVQFDLFTTLAAAEEILAKAMLHHEATRRSKP